jgi:hypothetical protein
VELLCEHPPYKYVRDHRIPKVLSVGRMVFVLRLLLLGADQGDVEDRAEAVLEYSEGGLETATQICVKSESHNGMWRSPVAHTAGGRGVAGSNPVIPTIEILHSTLREKMYVSTIFHVEFML